LQREQREILVIPPENRRKGFWGEKMLYFSLEEWISIEQGAQDCKIMT